MSNKDTGLRASKDFWFACVDIDVIRDKELSQSARFIFTVLCTFATTDNRGCWPSNDAVAEAAGVSKRTVIRAYQELETRGIIARSDRFKEEGSQTSSYTRIVGHNAECYDGVSDVALPHDTGDMPPMTQLTHKGNQVKDIKDSLTREAQLPDEPILVFEDGQPVDSPKPHNPEEVCTPDDAPEIMKSTAELFLHKTGRQGLTWDEISALRELSASQFPSRVQKEIDTAVKRFLKRGQPLSELTMGYIAGSLSHQPTRGKKRKLPKTAKPSPVPECTDEQAEAEMAEIAALQAKFDEEARTNGF